MKKTKFVAKMSDVLFGSWGECHSPTLLVSESEYGYTTEVPPVSHDDCCVAGGGSPSMYVSSVFTAGSRLLGG